MFVRSFVSMSGICFTLSLSSFSAAFAEALSPQVFLSHSYEKIACFILSDQLSKDAAVFMAQHRLEALASPVDLCEADGKVIENVTYSFNMSRSILVPEGAVQCLGSVVANNRLDSDANQEREFFTRSKIGISISSSCFLNPER